MKELCLGLFMNKKTSKSVKNSEATNTLATENCLMRQNKSNGQRIKKQVPYKMGNKTNIKGELLWASK